MLKKSASSAWRTGVVLVLSFSTIIATAPSLQSQVADVASAAAVPLQRSTRTVSLTPAAAGLGSLVVLSLIQTEPMQSFDEWTSSRLSGDGSLSDAWIRRGGRELGGNMATLAIASSPLAFGIVVGNSNARRLGLHSLESLYAADFLAMILKNVVGRARPNHSSDSDQFKLFSSEADFHSFPSAHATRVFALATVYSMGLKDDAPWVPYVAYPVAAWTATTRVMDRAHWLTDVTAGALIGYSTARVVEWLNHRERVPGRDMYLAVYPLSDGGFAAGVHIPMR
jgi:membrane-associated phospholipid phosphatase